MRERVFKDELIIDLDNNGNNYESFMKCVSFIRENLEITEQDYSAPFWDEGYFYFKHINEEFKITFSGFMGTELKIPECSSEDTRKKLRKIAKNLISNLNN